MCMLKTEQHPAPTDPEILRARLEEALGRVCVGGVINPEGLRKLIVGQYLPKEGEEK